MEARVNFGVSIEWVWVDVGEWRLMSGGESSGGWERACECVGVWVCVGGWW